MEWREADVAVGGPLLAGMNDAVGLVEAFGCSRSHMRACLLMFMEAGDIRGVEVDLRFPVNHPLGDRPACAGPLLHPHRRGGPQTLDIRRFAQHRHAVRGKRKDSVDGVLHADGLVAHDLRHQLQRVLHLLLEIALRKGELGRRERGLLDRRQVLRVVKNRAVRVGADLQVAARLALVHVRVHVPHDRVLDVRLRATKTRDRPDVDHLVHGRGQGDARSGHMGDARAPDAARDDHSLSFDLALGCAHAADPPGFDLDAEDLRFRGHLKRARGLRLFAHQRARA